MDNRPRVGVGVIVIRDNKVLLGKRKSSHGKGSWCFPGGKLEFEETIEECAEREVMEEVGIHIKNLELGTFTNDVFVKEKKHYITLYVISDHHSGEPRLMEPDKFEEWKWFGWDELPKPLFLPIRNLLKKNFNPFK